MGYVFLAAAIVSEVAATLSLRKAAHGSRRWYIPVVIGYLVAFTMLALVLAEGIGLGVAYGIWAAAGVAMTAVATKFLFGEPFTKLMAAGIAAIVAGVLLIELGAAH
ncbi:small multidrug resistance pump [Klenkia soli]|uniref:Small multidrug resistance pump n=1 Tax=Klenkia soli TaxID=1052260 RepID=A0A1H0GR40_9ACTN|nr:SMR family transporter [Klenkia soli]SDO09304.1 small multidrug resistance pump [Klenkia soli]